MLPVSSNHSANSTVELLVGTSLYVSKSKDDIPRNAIKAGLSPCGQVYVGAVSHQEIVMPAKIVPAYNLCYYSYDGREYNTSLKTYLTVDEGFSYEWVQWASSSLPQNAALIREPGKDPYYFGRVEIDGERCVGKITKSPLQCLVPKTGKEFIYKRCDVLCIRRNKHFGM